MGLLDNIIHYYKLDESGGDAIDWVGSDNGTIHGTTQDSEGIINTGYYFDGNDYVGFSVALLPTSTADDPFSVSLWCKGTDSGGTMYSNYDAVEQPPSRSGIRTISGKAVFWHGGSGTIVTSTTSIDDDVWHHVVVTKAGNGLNEMSIYVDGGIAEDTGTDNSKIDDTPAKLGTLSSGVFDYTGNIDEVGIWTRELTQAEVLELYNSGNGLAYPFIRIVGPFPTHFRV